MEAVLRSATVPSLAAVQTALAGLAPQDAMTHLDAAVRSLEGLSTSLQNGGSLAQADKRELERALLRFRTELRGAAVLAERGLAYCQDWAYNLQPPPAYQANGAVAGANCDQHNLSIEA